MMNKKKILKIASVVGRTFLYKILAAIVETKSVIKEQLSELQSIRFIRQTSNLSELEYVFYHTLTKEVAYESILIRQRLEIHRQIGQTIENLFKDQKEKVLFRIGLSLCTSQRLGKGSDLFI